MSETDTQPPADAAGEATDPAARRARLIDGLVPKLAIVVAVIATLIAGSLWWQYRQFYVELATQDSRLRLELEDARANLRGLEDVIGALRGQLSTNESAVTRVSDDLELLPAQLRALDRRVEALQGGRLDARDNWLREQAEYYLVLANTELVLAGRIDNATAALEQADDVLRELADPGLASVRAALSAELQSLRSTERPDLERLAVDLGSLIARAPDLPMRASSPENFGTGEADSADVEPGLGRLLARTGDALQSMVRIERQEEPVAPLLTESERRIVRRQLALELQLARTAALDRRQAAFRASLTTADAILERDFERGAQSIVEARRLLAGMMRIELAPRLPDISDSLTLLRSMPGAR